MDQRKPITPLQEAAPGERRAPTALEELMKAPVTDGAPVTRIDGVLIGRLIGFQENGRVPLVIVPGHLEFPTSARATTDLQASHIGRDVVLAFEGGDLRSPIVVGCLWQPTVAPLASTPGVQVEADGERLVVAADYGLVLGCGKASITLTPDGSIVVRGTRVISHASGLNRIRGGSVQLN